MAVAEGNDGGGGGQAESGGGQKRTNLPLFKKHRNRVYCSFF